MMWKAWRLFGVAALGFGLLGAAAQAAPLIGTSPSQESRASPGGGQASGSAAIPSPDASLVPRADGSAAGETVGLPSIPSVPLIATLNEPPGIATSTTQISPAPGVSPTLESLARQPLAPPGPLHPAAAEVMTSEDGATAGQPRGISIPEPTSIVLLVTGLVGLTARRHLRAKID